MPDTIMISASDELAWRQSHLLRHSKMTQHKNKRRELSWNMEIGIQACPGYQFNSSTFPDHWSFLRSNLEIPRYLQQEETIKMIAQMINLRSRGGR